ncbi:MAG: glycosyltransferase [Bacilli bacterium]|nr:glycosyltransferase [Bacillales bacterium]MDY2574876.1 glycosyltransferase [Bacilli bacterium]
MKVYLSHKNKAQFLHICYRLNRDLSTLYYLKGIDYCEDIKQDFDFAHFIDISQKNEIIYVKDILKKKVIINYFVNKKLSKNESLSDIVIPFEDKRILNKCDLVLVSCQADKMILIANEIKSPIEILPLPVKEERFTNISSLEKSSFFQYAGLVKEEKFALALVSYKNYQDIQDLIDLANLVTNIKFFVFGPSIKHYKLPLKIKSAINNAPKNIVFKSFVNEDIFKSAMLLSSFFIVTREADKEVMTILEAMITKTQIFTYNTHFTGDLLIDNENCLLAFSSNEMALLINKYLNNEISTIDKAYQIAKNNSYENSSEKLKQILEKYIDLNLPQE